ncbi:MAG TPA: PorV/PorQ family protein [Fibrobacteria bacterium]|nr:PorV/PorQ family protein [Fibrobacteria bacterium]HOX51867.1 PorV/PorQ family protein [Fibrobacteria bacterium]
MRILFALLGLASASYAQFGSAGSAEFVFLRNFQGARMVGMCGVPAAGEDLSSLGWQPASFARLQSTRLEVGYRAQMSDVVPGFAAYARPLWGGVIAGRMDYQSSGEITGVSDLGDPTGRIHRPQEMLLNVAFAEALGDRFAWGAGFKAVEENLDIDDSQAWGVAVDVGTVFQPGSRRFAHSLYVSNLGTKLSGHTKEESDFGSMPLSFGYTLLYRPGVRGLDLYQDVQKPVDNEFMLRTGVEYKVNDWVQVRGGFRTDLQEVEDAFRVWVLSRQDPDNPPLHDQRWALGGTVSNGSLALTYGFQWWRLLNAVHSLTLSWNVGASAAPAPSPLENP